MPSLARNTERGDWRGLLRRFLEFAHDSDHGQVAPADEKFALDRSSVRVIDDDGHLHVERANISKANVCPYRGDEIPDYEGLGLDPEKVYQLFRDPDELNKAAPTFSGKPLLFIHKPTDASDHAWEETVGAVTDAGFDAPYLTARLDVWPSVAIDAIQSGDQKELSCGYRYRADMTPGIHDGIPYDGVMRDIVGNHVALVKEGRAGPDVVVGDSKEGLKMGKRSPIGKVAQTVAAFIRPRLAKDAKVDLTAAFDGVTAKNFKDKKQAISDGVKKATAGKLAKDASVEDVTNLLDALEQAGVAADEIDPSTGVPSGQGMNTTGEVADEDPAVEFLRGKLSDEDLAEYQRMCAAKAASDEDPPEDEDERKRKAAEAAEAAANAARDNEMKENFVTKKAMDAALKSVADSVRRQERETREAYRDVQHYVGDLANMAHDSAVDVYRDALQTLKIDVTGVKELPALKTILHLQPKVGESRSADVTVRGAQIAQDALVDAESELETIVSGKGK